MVIKVQKLALIMIGVLMCNLSFSQRVANTELAKQYVATQLESLELSQSDFSDVIVSDAYVDRNSGIHHIYLNQSIDGIPIHNAIMNVVILQDETPKVVANRWINDAQSKVLGKSFSIEADVAVHSALTTAGIETKQDVQFKESINGQLIFNKVAATNGDIKVQKEYLVNEEGGIFAVWAVEMDMKEKADYWNMKIDAASGATLDKINYTVYCKVEHGMFTNHSNTCSGQHHAHEAITNVAASSMMGASYRVYALPAESPLHGPFEIVTDPHDPVASPFGWHDTNGIDGPEYTITRGNNVHAYEDRQNIDGSQGNEPDGGADLVFDFPHFVDEEPAFNIDAATVNLFYMNNMIHDFCYQYGFTEEAGNFQQNNFAQGGNGNDWVRAECMDGGGEDNANFATPPDGSSGRMQMYVWNQVDSRLVDIKEPAAIAGFIEVAPISFNGTWGFESYADVPFQGEIVLATDGSSSGGTQCCNDIANAEAVAGNIALIDRGTCQFGLKALNAQEAGAGACVICNVPGVNGGTGEELVTMDGGDFGSEVTIPTVFLPFSQCNRIRDQMLLGNKVILNIEQMEIQGPAQYNGSFDNGIVAHEFGHGVSNRLTAGPGAAGCLGNEEQMGEGWSDFFTLVTSVEEGDLPEDVRGVGVYANGEGVNGRGIRTFPYSTDMTINPETYDKVKVNSVPHGVGQVWCVMLWDLYWAMIDLYGYDPDINNKESGNSRAIQLVMDGMKLQPCSPGFVDGRDAILNADLFLYNGDHQCLIWEVFARRGLGYYADQGSTNDRSDGTEDFEPLPTCIKELKIKKSVPEIIDAGDELTVLVDLANHTESIATDVVITELVPDGLTYLSSTASVEPELNGDMLVFQMGDLESLYEESFEIVYASSISNYSSSLLLDDIEENTGNWDIPFEGSEGGNFFGYTSIASHSPDRSYYVAEEETESDQRLIYQNLSVTGDRPALRFWHRFDTEPAVDAGFIRISPAGDFDWVDVREAFLLNGYNSDVAYAVFAIPNHFGWTGSTNGEFIPTIIDLSAYAGTDIDVQFRYGTNEEVVANVAAPGWYIDDFELIDLRDYDSDICISSEENPSNCFGGTTLINVFTPSSNEDIIDESTAMTLVPNPAGNYVQLIINNDDATEYGVTIRNMNGVMVSKMNVGIVQNTLVRSIDTREFPSGMYVVQLQSDKGIVNQKLMIQR